jgi:hypothetical protein
MVFGKKKRKKSKKTEPAKCPSSSDQFNKLLADAQAAAACDSTCQRNKKIDDLRKKYEYAKGHMNPKMINEAEKHFFIFAKGQRVYNEMHEAKLKIQGHAVAKEVATNFKTAEHKIMDDIKNYNVLILNFPNVLDLYKTYKKQNIVLKKKIRDDGNDILTNERKTHYENQGSDALDTFFYVLTILFIIILIVFLVYVFKFRTDMPIMTKMGMFIGMIVLYFLSPYVLSAIIMAIYAIYGILPKNVHLTV